MKSTPEITPEILECLSRLRSFLLNTCPASVDFNDRPPAHSKVIRPLLASASEAFVWPPLNKLKPVPYPTDILTPQRGRHRFDLSSDILSGHERFWHAGAGARGSIALRLPCLPNNFIEILMHCSRPGSAVLSSRYQLTKGDSAGAIRYCDEVVDSGEFAFLFSASNGIQHLSVFAPAHELERLYRLALDWCRPFKRWFECVPGECVNLI